MATIRSLSLSVTARTEKFQRGLKGARLALHKFVSKIPGANMLLSKFSLALGSAAAVIGSTIWVKNTMAAVDATAKFADRIGMSVEGLQTLEHAATLTGVGVSQLRMGLQRMTRRIAEAAQGTGEARAALKELGLNARELANQRPEEMFYRIARAMGNVTNQADRVRLSMKLFDSEGVALANTLGLGEEELRKLNAQLREMGLLYSRADAGRIEEANDAITRLKLTVQAVANLATSVLAPAITRVTDAIQGWIKGKGNFRDRMMGVFEDMAGFVGAVINFVRDVAIKIQFYLGQILQKIGSHPLFRDDAMVRMGADMSAKAQSREYNKTNYEALFRGQVQGMRHQPGGPLVDHTRGLVQIQPGVYLRENARGDTSIVTDEQLLKNAMRSLQNLKQEQRVDGPERRQEIEVLRGIKRNTEHIGTAR